MSFVVAIDGPAGSGKGTVTKLIGEKFNLINIDSGAAYRCVALEIINEKIKLDDIGDIIDSINNIKIEYKFEDGVNRVFLNDIEVTSRIREKDVTELVSKVSPIKEIRFKLNDIFRSFAKKYDIIMEGRDIGTYVFPNADVKIYLDATAEERASRRYKQNQELGINASYEEILENIKLRDKNDMTREIGALKQADDAIYIDSSNMTIDEVVNKIIEIINLKRGI